jgi:hypothetical protein
MAKSTHGLNDKQLLFVNTYLDNNRNASAAYRLAYGNDGDNEAPEAHINSSASRLLRQDKIREYLVKVGMDKLAVTQRKEDISRSFLVQQYLDLIALAKKDNKNLSTAKGALDSLAHVCGLWQDSRRIEVTGAVRHDLATLDSTKLLRLLDQSQQETTGTSENIISNGASLGEDIIDAEYRQANDDTGDSADGK